MLYAEKLEGVVYGTESINAKNDKAFRPKTAQESAKAVRWTKKKTRLCLEC